jgi:hypothetical protein
MTRRTMGHHRCIVLRKPDGLRSPDGEMTLTAATLVRLMRDAEVSGAEEDDDQHAGLPELVREQVRSAAMSRLSDLNSHLLHESDHP